MPQCTATTKHNERCLNTAKDSSFCHVHRYQEHQLAVVHDESEEDDVASEEDNNEPDQGQSAPLQNTLNTPRPQLLSPAEGKRQPVYPSERYEAYRRSRSTTAEVPSRVPDEGHGHQHRSQTSGHPSFRGQEDKSSKPRRSPQPRRSDVANSTPSRAALPSLGGRPSQQSETPRLTYDEPIGAVYPWPARRGSSQPMRRSNRPTSMYLPESSSWDPLHDESEAQENAEALDELSDTLDHLKLDFENLKAKMYASKPKRHYWDA